MVDKKAPARKFRVIGVDTFPTPNLDYLIGDYDTVEEATQICADRGGPMNKTYVFDERGKMRANAGTM